MNRSTVQFLIDLKNYANLKREYLVIKYSKLSLQIITSLYEEGLIQSFRVLSTHQIFILLRYFFNKPVLCNLKIISTPSVFRYLKLHSLNQLFIKKSVLFFSTSKGVLTLEQCRKYKVGGKLLFYC